MYGGGNSNASLVDQIVEKNGWMYQGALKNGAPFGIGKLFKPDKSMAKIDHDHPNGVTILKDFDDVFHRTWSNDPSGCFGCQTLFDDLLRCLEQKGEEIMKSDASKWVEHGMNSLFPDQIRALKSWHIVKE